MKEENTTTLRGGWVPRALGGVCLLWWEKKTLPSSVGGNSVRVWGEPESRLEGGS